MTYLDPALELTVLHALADGANPSNESPPAEFYITLMRTVNTLITAYGPELAEGEGEEGVTRSHRCIALLQLFLVGYSLWSLSLIS